MIKVDSLVEKPGRAEAKGNLATVSGFLFTSEIFNYLNEVRGSLSQGQELYWTDAARRMMGDGVEIIAAEGRGGTYYDTGNKMG